MTAKRSSVRRPVYPVTVIQLPVVRCAQCQDTVSYDPASSSASDALTLHYGKKHPVVDRQGLEP